MLRGQEGRRWKGTYDLHFEHHRNAESLMQSVAMDCNICRVLCEELAVAVGLGAWDGSDETAGWIQKLKDRLLGDFPGLEDPNGALSSASLSILDESMSDHDQESKTAPETIYTITGFPSLGKS